MTDSRLINGIALDFDEMSIPRLLAHLAVSNHYPSLSFLLSGAKLLDSRTDASQLDLEKAAFGEADLTRFAELAGLSTDHMRALTYPPVSRDTRWKTHLFYNHPVPWTALAPLRPRACLHCVAEGRRSRLWDLTWYTACHYHHVPLTDTCSTTHCGGVLELFALEMGCCPKCHLKVEAPGVTAPQCAISLSRELAVQSSREAGHPASDAQSLTCLHLSINALALVAVPESSLGRFDYLPQRWSIARLMSIVDFVWPLLRRAETGPSYIDRLFQFSREKYPSLPDPIRLIRLRSAIEGLGSSTTKSRLTKQWEDAAASPSSILLDATPPDLEPFATMRELPEMLGTSPHNVLLLIKRGLLDGRRAFADRKLAEWVVPTASVDQLLQRIAKSPRLLRSSDAPLTDWNDYCQHPPAARIGGFVGVVNALLAGEITAVSTLGDHRFINLQIDPRSRTSPEVNSESISVAQAAAQLNTYSDVIYRLLKTSLLTSTSVVVGGKRNMVIAKGDLEDFRQTYVIASELARAWSVNVTNLSDRLRDAGIQPVSGPKVDGGLLFVFRRSDVEKLNVSELLSKDRYTSSAGRPAKGSAPRTHSPECVTTEVAAGLLGLSVQLVSLLVRDGHLAAHPDSRVIKNSRILYRDAVESYRQAWIDSPGRISVEAAAEKFGCTREQFYRRFVASGLVEVVTAPHGLRLVRLEQLDSIQREDRPMGLGDVSRSLGVPRYVVAQLHRRKQIEAAPMPGKRSRIYSAAETRDALREAKANLQRRRR